MLVYRRNELIHDHATTTVCLHNNSIWYYPRQLITLECIIFALQQQTQLEGKGLTLVEMEPPVDKWKGKSSTCFSEEGDY